MWRSVRRPYSFPSWSQNRYGRGGTQSHRKLRKPNPVECPLLCWIVTVRLEHTASVVALPSFDLHVVCTSVWCCLYFGFLFWSLDCKYWILMLVPVCVKWHHVRGTAVGKWTDGCPHFSVLCAGKICHRTLRNVRSSSEDLSARNYQLLFCAAATVRPSPWGKDSYEKFGCFVRRKCWGGYLGSETEGLDWGWWNFLITSFIEYCWYKLRTIKWVWPVANAWETINTFKNFNWKSRRKDDLVDWDVHRILLFKWTLWDCEQDSTGLGYGSLSVCVDPGDRATDCIKDC